MMRVGIIGGGFGLTVQAPIINTHPKMRVTAVSTMKRHLLPEELWGGENCPTHYKNWVEMLDNEELDLLFVSSIPIHHFEMVQCALEKGINVVCEKPFTANSKQSELLLQLSKQCHVKVLIDFEWRYLPVRQKVKNLLRSNEIGTILHVDYHISSPQYQTLKLEKRGWLGERQKFGGMLGAIGSHMIDCLRWLVRDEIDLINGLVHTHIPQGGGEYRDADDAFFLHGKMKNNTTFSMQLLSGIHHGFGSNLKIFGSSGTVTLTNDETLYLGKVNEQLSMLDVHSQEKPPLHLAKEVRAYYPAMYPFLDKIYDYIAENKMDEDLPTITDGHINQVIIDKIFGYQ